MSLRKAAVLLTCGAAISFSYPLAAQCPNTFERQPAAWATTSGLSMQGAGRVRIALNRTSRDTTGTEQHVAHSSTGANGLYYQYREAQADCFKKNSGGWDLVPASWSFDTVNGIVSEPNTDDFDLEVGYGQEGGLDGENGQAVLFRHLVDGPTHKIGFKTRTAGPSGTWTPSAITSHTDFRTSTQAISEIDLAIDAYNQNRRHAVWLELDGAISQRRIYWKDSTMAASTATILNAVGPDAEQDTFTPRITIYPDGTVFVVWTELRDKTEPVKYFIRVFGDDNPDDATPPQWWPPLNKEAKLFAEAPEFPTTIGPLQIAVGPDKLLHIVYIDSIVGDFDLAYQTFDFQPDPSNDTEPGTFSSPVKINSVSETVKSTDLVVDSFGAVHLAYGHTLSGSPTTERIGYRVNESGVWSEGFEQTSFSGMTQPVIDADGEENIHVAAGEDAANFSLSTAIKRVWTKEEGGASRWLALPAFDSWSGLTDTPMWNVSDAQEYDFEGKVQVNNEHESTNFYWFWDLSGNNFWHPRVRLPGDNAILFDYLAGNAFNTTTDRMEFQARMLDGLPGDVEGRVAARHTLGSRFPASSTIGSPLSANAGEGATFRGLEYYNPDSSSHYIAPRFRHQVMSSIFGDGANSVTFNRLWWRLREQGTLESAVISVTSLSPATLNYLNGIQNVTVTGTGFDPDGALVEVNHQPMTVTARSATSVTFQIDTSDPFFLNPLQGPYNPVVVINPESGVFEVYDGGLAVVDP